MMMTMKICRPQITPPHLLVPISRPNLGNDFRFHRRPFSVPASLRKPHMMVAAAKKSDGTEKAKAKVNGWAALAAATVGMAVVLAGLEAPKAVAYWPEGPLMEEFWDNMRRYALYALTVSTGALYIVFQPIVELLKNPISAVLVLVIAGGGFYLVSQVVSAMVGISDFSYQYAN